MRRTVNLALAAGVLIATGVSGVAASSERASRMDLAPSQWESPAPAGPPASPASTGSAGGSGQFGESGTRGESGPRQRVGTVERVEAVLGYRQERPSVTFHYPGADYVKVHLSRLRLLPGDYLTVSDPTGAEVHRYRAEPARGRPGGSVGGAGGWTTSISGETATVTLHRQAATGPGRSGRLGVTIDKVARGLLPAEPSGAAGGPAPATGREESICGRAEARDAVCYRSSHPRVYRNTKPVARLLINGVEMCTAFRVGAGNRLLTNHHCLADARDARRAEVWFNYQCAECDGWAVYRPTKVRADRILDTDRVLDYTLFTVDDFGAVERYGYLEIDGQPVRVGEEIYIPQHPRGLPGRVAMDSDRDSGGNCVVSATRAHGYGRHTDLAYYCDTEGGSSGSPVLSRASHRVIALHHFGGCPNGGVRMDLIYPRIADVLHSR